MPPFSPAVHIVFRVPPTMPCIRSKATRATWPFRPCMTYAVVLIVCAMLVMTGALYNAHTRHTQVVGDGDVSDVASKRKADETPCSGGARHGASPMKRRRNACMHLLTKPKRPPCMHMPKRPMAALEKRRCGGSSESALASARCVARACHRNMQTRIG